METAKKGGCDTNVYENEQRTKKVHAFVCGPRADNIPDVQHLVSCLQKETLTMKDLILNACELIYVCKVCHELYCSLEHFLDHNDDCKKQRLLGNNEINKILESANLMGNEVATVNISITADTSGLLPPNNSGGSGSGTSGGSSSTTLKAKAINKKYSKKLAKPKNASSGKINRSAVPSVKKVVKMGTALKRRDDSDPNRTYRIILGQENARFMNLKSLMCLECKKKFYSKFYLQKHVAVHHLGCKRFKCKLCLFKSNSIPECRKHMEECHKEEMEASEDVDKMVLHLYCTMSDTVSDTASATI